MGISIICLDLFDTLIKLTYNMQLYVAALKVASTWNRNCKFNRQLYHRQRHYSSFSTRQMSTRNEEKTDGSTNVRMDLDDGCNNKLSLSMDITEVDNTLPLTPLFSQIVALAKTIVFLSDDDETEIINISSIVNNDDEFMMHQEDEDVKNIISNNKLDRIDTSEDDGEILLLESYGRRSTLPFLRFAALLKKYIYSDDDDNLDDHPELTISSSQLNNLNVEQNKQREQLLDSQVLSPSKVEVNYNIDFSTSNDPHHHQHWSKDDYEYLMLARFLKLLNHNEDAHEASDHCEESYNHNCSYIEHNDDQNQNNCEKRQHMPLQPPSAMEAVMWPQWSYSTNDKNNKISTTISRTWFTSFRESLTTKIPKATIIGENTTTIVSSAAAEIDPNSKATTSANITMAARMLLFADCCDGGVSDDTRAGILDSSRSLFPPITWMGPRLLKLPHLYDDVFQYYHGRACHRCHGVPRETSVCLVCGTVVCLKENCCKTNHIYEAVQVCKLIIYINIIK